jgi:glutathione S-transferase
MVNPGDKLPEYGSLPALVHDDRVVVDSLAIIEYVDTRWPEPPLFPIRAGRDAVMSVIARVTEMFAPHLPRIARGTPIARVEALGAVRCSMGDLDGEVAASGYLMEEFSAADLVLASFIAALPPDWRPVPLGYRRLGRWEQTVMSRPAVREQMAFFGS